MQTFQSASLHFTCQNTNDLPLARPAYKGPVNSRRRRLRGLFRQSAVATQRGGVRNRPQSISPIHIEEEKTKKIIAFLLEIKLESDCYPAHGSVCAFPAPLHMHTYTPHTKPRHKQRRQKWEEKSFRRHGAAKSVSRGVGVGWGGGHFSKSSLCTSPSCPPPDHVGSDTQRNLPAGCQFSGGGRRRAGAEITPQREAQEKRFDTTTTIKALWAAPAMPGRR